MSAFRGICLPAARIPLLDAKAWRLELQHQLRSGARLVTVYGRPQGNDVLLTAVFQGLEGALSVSRASVARDEGYRSLTPELPLFHCFERELHEQTGLRLTGHPWLKPLRSEGKQQSEMAAYPYYRLEGKGVHEVAVGPIHAGVIEPGSFRFQCMGEQVHHLEIQLGYQHRGVERALLEGDAHRRVVLAETIAGDTSVGHAWACAAALEQLAGVDPSKEVYLARSFALELERVGMHLAGLAGLTADIGFLQGTATYSRLRTTAINTSMLLCGSRFGRGAVRAGGQGLVSLEEGVREEVAANLALLEKDLAIINRHFLSALTVRHRFEGVGVLGTELAAALGIVGMAGRASGLRVDQRSYRTDESHDSGAVEVCVEAAGDCMARARLRLVEIDASLSWLRRTLGGCQSWERSRRALSGLAPEHLSIAIVEGWRGEVVHCLETESTGQLCHYKVQDPSLRNWIGLALAVRENEISDFPICNKSFDLSYCGNDL